MKKTIISLIVIISLIIIVLIVWPRKFFINDGGSYGYEAVLYKITFHRQSKGLNPNAEHGISVRILFFEFYWSDE